jgi:hypothetical protein
MATSYSRSHDHEGRAAIRYDGKEIIKGCYWNNWAKAFYRFIWRQGVKGGQSTDTLPLQCLWSVKARL